MRLPTRLRVPGTESLPRWAHCLSTSGRGFPRVHVAWATGRGACTQGEYVGIDPLPSGLPPPLRCGPTLLCLSARSLRKRASERGFLLDLHTPHFPRPPSSAPSRLSVSGLSSRPGLAFEAPRDCRENCACARGRRTNFVGLDRGTGGCFADWHALMVVV